MKTHHIKRGLNIPIKGKPDQTIKEAPKVKTVALIGGDYPSLRPQLLVQEGDKVRMGQPLWHDKKIHAIQYMSPGTGTISHIHRGEKRRLISVVIQLDDQNDLQGPPMVNHGKGYAASQLSTLERGAVIADLLKTGLWTAIRQRPFSSVPDPKGSPPASLFVTAMHTEPYAPHVQTILRREEEAFQEGLNILSKLPQEKLYLCTATEESLETPAISNMEHHLFKGPHPAGLVGTHIHFIDPVNAERRAWHIGYQDVIAIGKTFMTGRLSVERYVSLAGEPLETPTILKTRLGANLHELTSTQPLKPHVKKEDIRLVSGFILSGRGVTEADGYLGRYHLGVSLLTEDRMRVFQGFLAPGNNLFSIKKVFVSSLMPWKTFSFGTSTRGSRRDMVPIGSYERVMPLRMVPTFLLRALLSKDLDKAEKLGVLELDEEDLALCSFVCPGKQEYGTLLREMLMRLEKEFE